ncbi:MAG: alanine racemase [Alphaproteobacteria bacterium]|nr:alanine racemase [Alphaproteobacteria bacterium]
MQLPVEIINAVKAQAQRPGQRSFYLYNTSVMRAKIGQLQRLVPRGVEIYYAMKANPHPAFLAAARKAGIAGIEIASAGEGAKAETAGFQPQEIIFTGPGKTPEELAWCLDRGIRTVHLESLAEAHRLNALCAAQGKTQDVLLRVNPDFDIHGAQARFSGGSQKLGVDAAKLQNIMPKLLELPYLRFRGLHVYAASGVLDVRDLLKNCELVFTMAQTIEQTFQGVHCAIIDFGGGFGIDYLESGHDFNPEAYAIGLQQLITRYGFADRRFVLELGRYLTADSGWYCTEILDIKDSYGTKQVICAGGTNHFRRPAALSINHPVVIVPMQRPRLFTEQESVKDERVYVGGPLCNTADKLARDIHLAQAEIGDFVVFCLAGAYGLSMSHLEFLSHARPEEILLG